MSMSHSRRMSQLKSKAFELVPVVRLEEQVNNRGVHVLVGSCGHFVGAISRHQVEAWSERIDNEKRHRKRCERCVKDEDARQEYLFHSY